MPRKPHRGLSLREAADIARQLGADVYIPRRNGEMRFSYPGVPSANVNSRKVQISRALLVWLKRLYNLRNPEKD